MPDFTTKECIEAIVKRYSLPSFDPNGDDPMFWDAVSGWHSKASDVVEAYDAYAAANTTKGAFCNGYLLMHAMQGLLEDMTVLLDHFCCSACAKDPVVRRYVKEALAKEAERAGQGQ